MHLVVNLRFGFLFKYFPQDDALCSYFAVVPEIPRGKPTSSGLEVQAKFYFQD